MDMLSESSDVSSDIDDKQMEVVDVLIPDGSQEYASSIPCGFSSAVEHLEEVQASGCASFSSYATAVTDPSTASESDAEAALWSRCTSLSSSILPPEIEEIGKLPPWCVRPEPVSRHSSTARRHTMPDLPALKSRKQWLTELKSKVCRILKLRNEVSQLFEPSTLKEPIVYGDCERDTVYIDTLFQFAVAKPILPTTGVPFDVVLKPVIDEAVNLISTSQGIKGLQTGSVFLPIFRTESFKAVWLRLDDTFENLAWFSYLLEPTRNIKVHNDRVVDEDGQWLPPLAYDDVNMFQVCSQLAKAYHAPPRDIFHEMKILVSLCGSKEDDARFLRVALSFLVHSRHVDHQALAYGQWLLCQKHLLCNGSGLNLIDSGQLSSAFRKTLVKKWTPSKVLYTLASAISELATGVPRWHSVSIIRDIETILVEHLTKFIEWGRPLEQVSDKIDGLWIEKVFIEVESTARVMAMFGRALWKLAKGSPIDTDRIVKTKLLTVCFTKLLTLENEPSEQRCVSVEFLMEITAVCGDNANLKQFFCVVYSKDVKFICEQLRNIDNESGAPHYDCSNIIPCVIALACLPNAFTTRHYSYKVHFYEGWEILGTLIHILEKRYPGVVTEEVAILISQHIPVRYLLHEPEMQVPELVILCCITKYIVFTEPEDMADVHTVLEWASEERYLTRDPTINRMILEAKSKLNQA